MKHKRVYFMVQQFLTRFFISLLMVGALLSVPIGQAQARENIVAVINGGVVTSTDLANRMKLIIVSSGMPDNAEIHEKLRPQILGNLIEEQLKLQEADRVGAEVTELEIDGGFLSIAKSNNMTSEEFTTVLKRSKVSPFSIREQIRANMAWSKVVQQEIHSSVSITDNQIDLMLERLQAGIGKTEYLVSEIFLSIDEPKDEAPVKQLANKLTHQLIDGKVPFPKVASQFSQSAGAANGGSLGWVQEGQLAAEIETALSKMEEGDLSQPVRTLAGYHIVYLRQKRTISAENIPPREQLLSKMGMEELERRARRYLLDLKAEAFIEERM